MRYLNNILVFVRLPQSESVTRAARSLAMPISTVSRRLSVLESELGVAVVKRATRRVTLTVQGGSTSASARSDGRGHTYRFPAKLSHSAIYKVVSFTP